MGKSKGSTTSTVDPLAQQRAQQVWNAAQTAGNHVDPYTQGAANFYQGGMNSGNLGMAALGGDKGAYAQLSNPYQQQVTDASMRQFGQLQNMTTQHINDSATQANAFGGGRHGVAEGVAQGQLGQGEQQQLANLNYQGFGDTMGRAGNLANMGFNSAQGAAGIAGMADPALRQYNLMQHAYGSMPQGQVQTQEAGHNPLTGAIGGGLAAFGSTGNPWLGVLGGIGGLFK